jgi:hypothetical protein
MAAGATADVYFEPDTILIVIDHQLNDALHKSAGRALVPQQLAAAAVVIRLAGPDRQLQCFGIHVALHQKLTTGGIGRNNGNQAPIVKLRRKIGSLFDLFDIPAELKIDNVTRHRDSGIYVLAA